MGTHSLTYFSSPFRTLLTNTLHQDEAARYNLLQVSQDPWLTSESADETQVAEFIAQLLEIQRERRVQQLIETQERREREQKEQRVYRPAQKYHSEAQTDVQDLFESEEFKGLEIQSKKLAEISTWNANTFPVCGLEYESTLADKVISGASEKEESASEYLWKIKISSDSEIVKEAKSEQDLLLEAVAQVQQKEGQEIQPMQPIQEEVVMEIRLGKLQERIVCQAIKLEGSMRLFYKVFNIMEKLESAL